MTKFFVLAVLVIGCSGGADGTPATDEPNPGITIEHNGLTEVRYRLEPWGGSQFIITESDPVATVLLGAAAGLERGMFSIRFSPATDRATIWNYDQETGIALKVVDLQIFP